MLEFSGEIWYWRGPAPFYFISVPEPQCESIKAVANMVTYGWGMIPVEVRIGGTVWKTSLWPKDGGYVVPIKTSVRKAESLEEGSIASVTLEVWAGKMT